MRRRGHKQQLMAEGAQPESCRDVSRMRVCLCRGSWAEEGSDSAGERSLAAAPPREADQDSTRCSERESRLPLPTAVSMDLAEDTVLTSSGAGRQGALRYH